jgi:O-antigen/teichoic acid export membrane protein
MMSSLLNSGFGYLFWVIATHAYSPEKIGIASAAISAGTLVAIVSDLGVRSLMMQTLPKLRESRAWSAQVSAGIFLSGTSTVLGAIVALIAFRLWSPTLSRGFANDWGLAFTLLAATFTLGMLLDGIATAERRGTQLVLRNIAAALVKLALIAAAPLLYLKSGQTIVLAAALGQLVACLYGLLWQLRSAHPGWAFSLGELGSTVRSIRRGLIGHHILGLSGYLPIYVIPLEVVARLGATENAYMTLTWMVGGVFFVISPTVGSMLFVQARWEPAALRAAITRSISLIAVLLFPVALLSVIFGQFILSLFGHAYAQNGYGLLCVLALSTLPDAITNIYTGVLRAKDRVSEAATMNFAMAVVAIVASWFLLPHFGIVGAGLAWLGAQSAGSVWAAISGLRMRSRIVRAGKHRK